MTLEEQYVWEQERCGLKSGDKVRVTCKANSGERGWNNYWVERMDELIGEELEVASVHPNGVLLSPRFYCFPYFVLERVVEAPNGAIDLGRYNTKCLRCGAPAYQGLGPIECSGGCR